MHSVSRFHATSPVPRGNLFFQQALYEFLLVFDTGSPFNLPVSFGHKKHEHVDKMIPQGIYTVLQLNPVVA